MTLFVFVIVLKTPISNFGFFSERSGGILGSPGDSSSGLESPRDSSSGLGSPGDSGSGLGGPGESWRLRFWIGES